VGRCTAPIPAADAERQPATTQTRRLGGSPADGDVDSTRCNARFLNRPVGAVHCGRGSPRPFGDGYRRGDLFGGGDGGFGCHEPCDQVVADRVAVGQRTSGASQRSTCTCSKTDPTRPGPSSASKLEGGAARGGPAPASRGGWWWRRGGSPGDKDPMGLLDRHGRLGEMVEQVDGHGALKTSATNGRAARRAGPRAADGPAAWWLRRPVRPAAVADGPPAPPAGRLPRSRGRVRAVAGPRPAARPGGRTGSESPSGAGGSLWPPAGTARLRS
jgi:hypothetical protein